MNAFISTSSFALTRTTSFVPKCATTRRMPIAKPTPAATKRVTMTLDPLSTTQLLADNPAFLQTIANGFNSLGMPTPLVEYGHPAMMALMILTLGAPSAFAGWKGRLNEDKKAGLKQKKVHELGMIIFTLLAILGGSGGTLSVAMQGYDVWTSPHFLSAVTVIVLLGANATIAYTGFSIGNDGTPKGRQAGRKLHAYFGSAVMLALLVHGALGVNILLG